MIDHSRLHIYGKELQKVKKDFSPAILDKKIWYFLLTRIKACYIKENDKCPRRKKIDEARRKELPSPIALGRQTEPLWSWEYFLFDQRVFIRSFPEAGLFL
jgi:hypothetical protein